MGKRKATKRTAGRTRAKVGDLPVKKAGKVKGGFSAAGTAAPFIPGAGVISSAISGTGSVRGGT